MTRTDADAGPGTAPSLPGTGARKLVLLCVSALTVMSGATISASLPGIEAHFRNLDHAGLMTRFVLTVPALSIAVCALPAGWFIDRFGRRGTLLAALLLFAGAGTSGLYLDSMPALLAGRALLGVAVAATMTSATALVGDYFVGHERDRMMGWQASFMGLGGLVFLTGGGLLAELHWRAPFLIYGLSLFLLPAVLAWLPEPRRDAGPGADGPPPAAAGGAVPALLALAFLVMAAFYMIPTQLPFFLVSMGIDSPLRAGLAVGVGTSVSSVAALGFAAVRFRVGATGVFALGFAAMAAGYALTALATGYGGVLAAMVVTGVGMGLAIPNLVASVMSAAPAALRGRVSGGLTASFFAGQFASPLFSSPWIAGHGYASAFGWAGVALGLLAGGLLALRLRLAATG